MAPEIARPPLAEQPWFKEFLEERGYQQSAPATFTNGRATVRLEGNVLYAIPGDGTKSWRSELNQAPPDAIRQLLKTVLASPSFLSQTEIDYRSTRQAAAEASLDKIGDSIRNHPDTHSGVRLRQFVWSLYNGHHALNLWRMKDVLDSAHNTAVTDVFTAWMQGFVSEDALRRTLVDSGEMDRWDTVRLRAPDQRRLVEAVDAVSDLLNSVPPCAPVTELTRANGLLREVMDCLRNAKNAHMKS